METYQGENIVGCYVSEKFDGVQGAWDGQTMRTRTGNAICLPEWVANQLPDYPLVGELWAGRGNFDHIRALVQKKKPADSDWSGVNYMVFGGRISVPGFAINVKQERLASKKQLNRFYDEVLDGGGEGVVITDVNGWMVKKKPLNDADGEVVDYIPGTGRNSGMVGSLVLKLENGRMLKVGGLNDELRRKPPAFGTIIKFQYQGKTSSGLPRGARFLAIRAEQKPSDEISHDRAVVTNTWRPGDKGTKKLMKQYPGLTAVRRYKMPDGTIKKTVEIEVE